MNQLSNNSFKIVNTMIKDGYKVVGRWDKGVVLQKDDKIEIVPCELRSKTACEAKTIDVSNEKTTHGKEELFKLYKANLATEAQVKSAVNTKDCGRAL